METPKFFAKGTLPGWLTFAAISLCAGLLGDMKTDFRRLIKDNAQHDKDIAILQVESKTFEHGLQDIVLELKALNKSVKDK